MIGLVGALIGGTIGAYMPPNTTFTADSIMKGLTYELNQVNAGVAAIKEDSGLSLITSLIPALGAAMAQQPNLGRGPANQQGPYQPPPPPAVILEAPKPASKPEGMAGMDMGKPKDGVVPKPVESMPKSAESLPKPSEAPESAESKQKGGGMAGLEMAPPPSAGSPKPAPPPNVAPAEPKTPNPVVPSAPLVPSVPAMPSTPSFPGLEDVAPAAVPVAAPPMSGTEGMSGHGGRRR